MVGDDFRGIIKVPNQGLLIIPYKITICEETLIKRSDVARILHDSGRLADFLNNPQAFLEKSENYPPQPSCSCYRRGIKYIKLDGQEYYAQEIFSGGELAANLDKDAVAVKHSVYDYVIYDSSYFCFLFPVSMFSKTYPPISTRTAPPRTRYIVLVSTLVSKK